MSKSSLLFAMMRVVSLFLDVFFEVLNTVSGCWVHICPASAVHYLQKVSLTNLISRKYGGKKLMKSNLRNEIKSYIVRQGMTMQEVVDLLRDEHGWSDSVSNLSNKLQRESLRYVEAVQLADALGYEIVWQKRR